RATGSSGRLAFRPRPRARRSPSAGQTGRSTAAARRRRSHMTRRPGPSPPSSPPSTPDARPPSTTGPSPTPARRHARGSSRGPGRPRYRRRTHEPSVSKGETMTTLENRPKTALLVVDVQKGVVEGAPERDTVVANVGTLVEKARRERVPVVWVQHSDEGVARGSDAWRSVADLSSDSVETIDT